MADSATILIQDISGCTEFPTRAELVHSSQIINELLEAILAPDEGDSADPPTERIGLPHICIFHGLTVEWETVKSEIGEDEILYVEDGRIVEKDLPARASFVLKRLGERRTYLRFHAKWLSSPEPPRELTSAILADYMRGLESIRSVCEST